jgi:hypothetical protein
VLLCTPENQRVIISAVKMGVLSSLSGSRPFSALVLSQFLRFAVRMSLFSEVLTEEMSFPCPFLPAYDALAGHCNCRVY